MLLPTPLPDITWNGDVRKIDYRRFMVGQVLGLYETDRDGVRSNRFRTYIIEWHVKQPYVYTLKFAGDQTRKSEDVGTFATLAECIKEAGIHWDDEKAAPANSGNATTRMKADRVKPPLKCPVCKRSHWVSLLPNTPAAHCIFCGRVTFRAD